MDRQRLKDGKRGGSKEK